MEENTNNGCRLCRNVIVSGRSERGNPWENGREKVKRYKAKVDDYAVGNKLCALS